MAEERFAIVGSDNVVVAACMWDREAHPEWTPPGPEQSAQSCGDNVGPGWIFHPQNGTFSPPPAPLVMFAPIEVQTAFIAWGVLAAVIAQADADTKAAFFAATSIPETEPRLLATLSALGKTIHDLKVAVGRA